MGAATSIIFCRDKHTFVATKDVFCRDKHVFMFVAFYDIMFVASNICCDKNCCDKSMFLLSRQAYFCRDKTLVATNTCLCLSHFMTCLSRQIFVVTKIVATKICFSCRDKHTFVATKHLSRGVCRDKNNTCGRSRLWYYWPQVRVLAYCSDCSALVSGYCVAV